MILLTSNDGHLVIIIKRNALGIREHVASNQIGFVWLFFFKIKARKFTIERMIDWFRNNGREKKNSNRL